MGRVGNAGQGHHADPFSLSFIIQEKERLVLNDRTSQRSSKLIIVKRCLWLVRRIKEIARIQSIIAEIFECASVELIRSALGHDIHDCAAISAVLRFEI